MKIVEKERIIRSEQLLRIVQHNAFIALIAVDPVGSLLGLAQRFFHKSKKTRLECFQPCGIVGQQRCRPHAGERLIDHPRIRRVRRRTVVQKTHLGLIHLTPARKVFRPQLRGFRQGVKPGARIFPAFSIVRRRSQQRVGLAGKTNAHLLVKTRERKSARSRIGPDFVQCQVEVMAKEQRILDRFSHQRPRQLLKAGPEE